MKKKLMMGLLAVISVSCVLPSAYASAANDNTAVVSSQGASKQIVKVCELFDKAVMSIQKNPKDLDRIGETMEESIKDLDLKQKLTPADKSLLKKTMRNLMVVVVSTQMEQNPQMAQMLGSLSEDQKKEMLDMAMQIAGKEIDAKIDACETLEDFSNISM